MNRRTFISALAATSLTPIIPPQIFASGGIVNPDHCGFVPPDPIYNAFMNGTGVWRGGLITT